jgi:DNA-binding CsgD family transcriptional regulator
MIELTPKELKLLKLICDDHRNADIAAKLDLKLRYLEKQKTVLYKKTKTHSGVGLLKWAVSNGFYKIKIKPQRSRVRS